MIRPVATAPPAYLDLRSTPLMDESTSVQYVAPVPLDATTAPLWKMAPMVQVAEEMPSPKTLTALRLPALPKPKITRLRLFPHPYEYPLCWKVLPLQSIVDFLALTCWMDILAETSVTGAAVAGADAIVGTITAHAPRTAAAILVLSI